MSAAVEGVRSRFEPLFSSEGYAFRAEIEPDQTARADGRRIEQVLYNLIGNAMNYIGPDKLVFLRVKGLEDAVRVEVSDHGAGIAEEELPRIWERYYKARDHVRERRARGWGSHCEGILEMHGAGTGAESRWARGSTFGSS